MEPSYLETLTQSLPLPTTGYYAINKTNNVFTHHLYMITIGYTRASGARAYYPPDSVISRLMVPLQLRGEKENTMCFQSTHMSLNSFHFE